MSNFKWIRFVLLAGLMLSLPLSNASAVSISLRPDGPTTIDIGGTVNVDVYIVLDEADQIAGIGSVTMHIEKGSAFVDVTASGVGCPFDTCTVNPNTGGNDFIVFSQLGTGAAVPAGIFTEDIFLGTIGITGRELGTYDMLARRFGSFPLIASSGQTANRYDFSTDESLTITIVPEPGTLVLLGASLAGLAFLRRRVA